MEGGIQYDFNEKLLTAVYAKQPPPVEEVLRRRDSAMPYAVEPGTPLCSGMVPSRRMSLDDAPNGTVPPV
jgi:hypothetical protein